MKKLLIMLFIMLGVVYAQPKPFLTFETEIIPYRLVPSQAMGYGCWLEIEFIGLPESMRGDDELIDALNRMVVQKETGEIGFNEKDFKWNNKQYILVKIQVPSPYDVIPKSVEISPYE